MELKEKIRTVPNFPKEGIMFRDITTLLRDPEALRHAIKLFAEQYRDKHIDIIVGPESRGFIFGTPLACELGVGFVPVRKPGKLPAEVESQEYELEYGTDKLEIHKDAIKPGDNVLIVDDLLATAGTAKAVTKIVEKLGGNVIGLGFLIELSFLSGREKLQGYNIFSIIDYKEE